MYITCQESLYVIAPFLRKLRITLTQYWIPVLTIIHTIVEDIWRWRWRYFFNPLNPSPLLAVLISCSYSLSWRCTNAAVLSAVRAQTFSSSTDWTSSKFRRSSLIRRVSRCLGTPDKAGWKQHHNGPKPTKTPNINWQDSGTKTKDLPSSTMTIVSRMMRNVVMRTRTEKM